MPCRLNWSYKSNWFRLPRVQFGAKVCNPFTPVRIVCSCIQMINLLHFRFLETENTITLWIQTNEWNRWVSIGSIRCGWEFRKTGKLTARVSYQFSFRKGNTSKRGTDEEKQKESNPTWQCVNLRTYIWPLSAKKLLQEMQWDNIWRNKMILHALHFK